MRIVGLGRGLFAISVAGLAILSLVYHDFSPTWQPLPAWVPGRELWGYGSGLLLLAASAGLCFSRTALPSALIIGAYLAVCALLSAGPVVSKPLSIGAWYGFFEALTALLGVWILYAMLRRQSDMTEAPPFAGEPAVRAAQFLFGLACVFYGSSHFVYDDYTASMVPGWLPARMGFAYFTGLGHLMAGIGIAIGILPRLAATLEAIMMSLFGLLVWAPSLWANPTPAWATPPRTQWSEIVVTVLLAASAWIVATSLRNKPWGFARRRAMT
jgi:uncharacterized membrane protein YphA (DoxX/SURF4 family)